MEKIFDLSIVTQEKTLYQGKAVSLVVPAALGYLGVLAAHAPLVANLKSGKIIVREGSGGTIVLSCDNKGFVEVLNNKVSVILRQ